MWYKKFSGIIILLFIAQVVWGQNGFYRNYGGSGNDYGLGVVGTFDKGYAIVGATESFGHGAVDMYLLKIDSLGDYVYSKTFGGPNVEWGYDITQTPDSGFVLCGFTNSFGVGYDVIVVRTDQSGNQLWAKYVDMGQWEFGYSLVDLSTNEFLVAGEVIQLSTGISDGLIIKLSNVGDTLWTKQIGNEWNDHINAVIVNSEGDYVFAGTSEDEEGVWRAWVFKTDIQGNIIWEYFYGSDGIYEAFDVIELNDGTYVVTGTAESSTTNGKDHLLLKLFSNGTLFFANALDDAYEDFGVKSIQYSGQSGFITIGYTDSYGFGGLEIRTAERDNYLNYIGTSNYNHFYGTDKDEWVHDADTTYDKGFVLVGVSESTQFGSVSIVVVKKDSTSYSPVFTSEVYDLATNLANEPPSLRIYPNPVKDVAFIQTMQKLEDSNYSIIDVTGKVVCRGKTSGSVSADFASGVYFLFLEKENVYLKFIKE
jgi:hypothetical protein